MGRIKTHKDMKPKKVLKKLKKGNKRFVKNLSLNRDLLKEAKSTSESQSPIAVVLSCLDSRILEKRVTFYPKWRKRVT